MHDGEIGHLGRDEALQGDQLAGEDVGDAQPRQQQRVGGRVLVPKVQPAGQDRVVAAAGVGDAVSARGVGRAGAGGGGRRRGQGTAVHHGAVLSRQDRKQVLTIHRLGRSLGIKSASFGMCYGLITYGNSLQYIVVTWKKQPFTFFSDCV